MTKQQLLDGAKALPPAERHELSEELRQFDDDGILTPEQRAELLRRVQEADRGEVEWLDGDQVMRELFDRLRRRRQ